MYKSRYYKAEKNTSYFTVKFREGKEKACPYFLQSFLFETRSDLTKTRF